MDPVLNSPEQKADIGNEGKHFYVVSGDEWTLGQQQKPLDTWTVVPMLPECTRIVCTSWTLGQYYDIKQLGQFQPPAPYPRCDWDQTSKQ